MRGLESCSRRIVRGTEPLLCQQLEDLGIPVAPPDVFTPFDLVGDEIKGRLGPVPVLVIGTAEVAQVLAAAGHSPVPVEGMA